MKQGWSLTPIHSGLFHPSSHSIVCIVEEGADSHANMKVCEGSKVILRAESETVQSSKSVFQNVDTVLFSFYHPPLRASLQSRLSSKSLTGVLPHLCKSTCNWVGKGGHANRKVLLRTEWADPMLCNRAGRVRVQILALSATTKTRTAEVMNEHFYHRYQQQGLEFRAVRREESSESKPQSS